MDVGRTDISEVSAVLLEDERRRLSKMQVPESVGESSNVRTDTY
jgi:hypothetical protein